MPKVNGKSKSRSQARKGVSSGTSIKKHRINGHKPNENHFRGKSDSNSKKKKKTTRKQGRAKRGTHKNKYPRK